MHKILPILYLVLQLEVQNITSAFLQHLDCTIVPTQVDKKSR